MPAESETRQKNDKAVDKISQPRVIREEAFARRLNKASEDHSLVPPLHSGRLRWISDEMRKKYDETVSIESVRKWFSGEAKPRPLKLVKLANLLQVDVGWLSLGIDTMQPRERRLRNAVADGAVNLIAGLIQMDGGIPAFPEDSDITAKENHVDLHAIIRGAKYDLYVSVGEMHGEQIRFSVPMNCEAIVLIGIVKIDFTLKLFEITSELIEQGNRKGGLVEITVDESDSNLRKIESFKNRL